MIERGVEALMHDVLTILCLIGSSMQPGVRRSFDITMRGVRRTKLSYSLWLCLIWIGTYEVSNRRWALDTWANRRAICHEWRYMKN